jgi:hypothetical protein
MRTVRTPKSRRKPVRLDYVLDKIPGTSRMGLTILVDGKGVNYWLSPIPSDFGTGYRFEKFLVDGGDVYDVLLSPDGMHTCECLGHLAHVDKGTVCKHIATLLQMRSDGVL